MNETAGVEVVPTFDKADRMRKALRVSGTSVQDMAEYLGCSRTSISSWINGRVSPSRQTVRLWALRTGTSFAWLETGDEGGEVAHPPDPAGGQPKHAAA